MNDAEYEYNAGLAAQAEAEYQATALDIKSWCIESAPYWSISKISRIETDVWSCCDEMFWLNKDFTRWERKPTHRFLAWVG
jgi:hypothetical protein